MATKNLQIQQSQINASLDSEEKEIFRILIASDNHLGHNENHPICGNDSFEAFEEVLKQARQTNSDFLLLGGDLFDQNNPSQESHYKCIQILNKYIYGDRNINFTVSLFDDNKNLPNFASENINIDLPIYIIHGNHDYPCHDNGNLSILNLLHESQYMNYFGKITEYSDIIKVKPILFSKGSENEIKIALYGIGYIKDTRLRYYLEKGKIQFEGPEENEEQYIKILVIHQNRFKGLRAGAPFKNSIHPQLFPNIFNLIIWGHEHESYVDFEYFSANNTYIYQPGSSVATSLIEAEAKMKHIGLISFVKKNNNIQLYLQTIPLIESHRKILYKHIDMDQIIQNYSNSYLVDNKLKSELIEESLENEIMSLLNENEEN